MNCLSSHDWMCSLETSRYAGCGGRGWRGPAPGWRASGGTKRERALSVEEGAPDGVAVGPDHHRPTHGAVVCQLRLTHDVQVPPAGGWRGVDSASAAVGLAVSPPHRRRVRRPAHTHGCLAIPTPHLEKSTDLGVTATSTALPPPPPPPLPGLDAPCAGDGTASTLPPALHARALPLLLLPQLGPWGATHCPEAWPSNTWAGRATAPLLSGHSMHMPVSAQTPKAAAGAARGAMQGALPDRRTAGVPSAQPSTGPPCAVRPPGWLACGVVSR